MSLSLKYRPSDFNSLMGQDHIKITLQNAISEKRIAKAYLFCGPRGTGKTSTARLMARAINCEKSATGEEICGTSNPCEMCKLFFEGKLQDILEIDGASNRSIDDVRDLREKVRFAPTIAPFKVYIIDEVHMLTKEAFNALLKTLEEPPSHVYFIFATTESHKLPETIISRCQRFDFHRISDDALLECLVGIANKEQIKYDETALQYIAKRSQGGLRDAIGLLEQITKNGEINMPNAIAILGLASNQVVLELLNLLLENKRAEALKLLHQIHSEGFNMEEFTKQLIEEVSEFLRKSVNENDDVKIARAMKILSIIYQYSAKSFGIALPQFSLELAIIAICSEIEATDESTHFDKLSVQKTTSITQDPKVMPAKEQPKAVVSTPKVVEKAMPVESNQPFTIEALKSKWSEIISNIKDPGKRTALKFGQPSSLDGNNIIVSFSSEFYLNNAKDPNTIHDCEAQINTVFKSNARCVFRLKEVDLAPVKEADEDIEIESVFQNW